ncbi:DNA-binding transcriptional ArsR family regulator [Paenibacillus endophyticus]|uniref:DNA-binding transcriptional ArsR family regulator n=1 Tax=Paenibacillus endophyticus TaxID=1294268 RepID=A0A7W5CCH2_9BACL|nr:metalloregulator ArsR/SmtB family transcription factor [Paenibacillus endophyticus]MBB3155178.1 DNA-binding transcriptional ArsR family regulator [Paenibacillus endophyticus]
MVKQHDDELDAIFHALSDPTRREMVRLMSLQERTVSELAAPFDMSLAAASKHIKVLEHTGLLHRTVAGRTHICSLDRQALASASKWLHVYEQFWNHQFDALERELSKAEKEKH